MEKKILTVKEIFCGMPRLKSYFSELDRKIRLYTPTEGLCEEVERLKKTRKELLTAAKSLDIEDLRIIFYLHQLKNHLPTLAAHSLKKLYEAQEDFIGLLRAPQEK